VAVTDLHGYTPTQVARTRPDVLPKLAKYTLASIRFG